MKVHQAHLHTPLQVSKSAWWTQLNRAKHMQPLIQASVHVHLHIHAHAYIPYTQSHTQSHSHTHLQAFKSAWWRRLEATITATLGTLEGDLKPTMAIEKVRAWREQEQDPPHSPPPPHTHTHHHHHHFMPTPES